MKQTIGTIIGAIIIAAAIYLAGQGGSGAVSGSSSYDKQMVELREKEVAQQAEHQCAMAYRYTTTDPSGATVSYPAEQLYKKCLTEKGL